MIGVELSAMLSNINNADIIKGIVKDIRFIDYAEVTAVNERYVDLKREDVIMTNVEVVSLGCNGYSINLVPKVGDYVIVFSSRTFIKDTATLEQDTAVDSYSAPTLKCLPICSSASKSAVSLITIDENGFTFKDTADTKDTDKHNTVLINKDGISITDRNGNTVAMNKDGIAVEDNNKNKVTLNSKGLAVEDANKNKITLSSDGFSINDSANNKIVSSSSGLIITDANSKKIEMSKSGTVINGKLTVL